MRSPADRLTVVRTLYTSEQPIVDPHRPPSRVHVLLTDFHYPIVRVHERFARDPRTGQNKLIGQSAMVGDHVLVQLREHVSAAEVSTRAAHLGLTVRSHDATEGRALLAFEGANGDRLPDVLTQLAAESAWVEMAEPDYLVAICTVPNDPAFVDNTQWALHNTGQTGGLADQDMNAPEAWALRTTAEDVVVAIIDTGLRLTHEDLQANLWINPGESGEGREANGIDDDRNGYVDDVHGIDAITRRGIAGDGHGHGTHVAGIVGAVGNNGRGLAGVAWKVQLMPLRFIGTRGVGATSDAIACLDYARRAGVPIANASWGSPDDSTLLQQAIAAATGSGMIFVTAAGNSNHDLASRPFYPAAYDLPGLVTVASTNRAGQLSSFSNYGSAQLAAPGQEIYSTWDESDSSYETISGTSMAAPHVAGALALLRQHYPADTRDRLISRLLASGRKSSALTGKVVYGKSPDLHRALAEATIADVPVLTLPASLTIELGGTLDLSVTATGTPPMSFQWLRDGVALPGATAARLVLSGFKAEWRGDYAVVATNATGSITSRSTAVSVIGPPSLLSHPATQTVVIGNRLELAVAATVNGGGSLTYRWYRDGTLLSGADAASWEVVSVSSADAGRYRVAVTNRYGTVLSDEATVTVVPAVAPRIVAVPQSQTVTADQDVAFAVQAEGTPTLRYQWSKDGVPLAGSTSATFTLHRAQADDAGLYTVEIANSGGTTASAPVRLSVHSVPVAPFFVLQPVDRAASAGETVTLSALAKGTPTATYQWQRNGVALAGADQPQLTLLKVGTADAGEYRVRVTNASGTALSDPAYLRVDTGLGQQRWQWRSPLPQGNDLIRLARCGGEFIAVGRHGSIVTSPNALAWTVRSTGLSRTFRAIATDGERRVVAVGDGGTIAFSPDAGRTWTPCSSGVNRNLMGVAYGNGRFVATAYEFYQSDGLPHAVLTSTDGLTWTKQRDDRGPTYDNFSGTLAFIEGSFYAADASGKIARSADGINWTVSETGQDESILVLVHRAGTFVGIAFEGRILSSADGVAWKTRLTTKLAFIDLIATADEFVALHDSGDVYTSPDGIEWTLRPTSLGGLPYPYALLHADGLYLVAGETGSIRTSPDLKTWKTVVGASAGYFLSVAHGPAGFFATGGNTLLHSADGVLWNNLAMPDRSDPLRRIAYLNGHYVGAGNKAVYSTKDGIAWTSHMAPPVGDIAHGDGLWAITSSQGKIYTSPDLTNWTERFADPAVSLYRIAYGGGRFIALSTNKEFVVSSDGRTWTLVRPEVPYSSNHLVYGDGRWVAVGVYKSVLTSVDGLAWTDVSIPEEPYRAQFKNLMAVTYAAGHFVAVGSSGVLLTSTDGVTWTERSTGSAALLLSICDGNDSLVAVGYGRTILQSGGLTPAPDSLGPTPDRQTVALGQTLALDLDSRDISGRTYQWLKDGQPLAGATLPTLRRTRTALADAGVYALAIRDTGATLRSQSAYVAVAGFSADTPSPSPEGSEGRLQIAAPSGFSWMAGTHDPWITIASAPRGSGNGEVLYTLSPNTSGLTRSGTLALENRVFAIVQPGLTLPVQPAAAMTPVGEPASLILRASSVPSTTTQWRRNGRTVDQATSPQMTLAAVRPTDTGLYDAVVSNGATTVTSRPAILGVTTTAKVVGDGSEIGPDIVHPNGRTFDQMLLQGAAASITADPGQVSRISYLDLDDDIVQIEFSGAGTLSVVLESPTGPAPPTRYSQPNVSYMRGLAGIVLVGADETTHLSVFSVGRANAFDPTGTFDFLRPISANNDPTKNGSPLFVGHASTVYDGVADLAFVAIQSETGKFGGLRAANVSFYATRGYTGLYAPGVRFSGPVYVGDIEAFDDAVPCLVFGGADDVRITGGDLRQASARSVQVEGLARLRFVAGSTSHGRGLPAQPNAARFARDGADVTGDILIVREQ